MWRQVVYTHGAFTGKCCAQQAQQFSRRRLIRGATILIPRFMSRHLDKIRCLSSAQPSWETESSPFSMSLESSLKQVPNPTAQRVVMKTFLNTLELNSVPVETNIVQEENNLEDKSTDDITTEHASRVETSQQWALQVIQTETSSALVAVSSVVTVPRESDNNKATTSSNNPTTPVANSEKVKRPRHVSHQRLLRAMNNQNLTEAKRAYRECLANDQHMTRHVLVQLFYGFVPTDPIIALSVLQQYKKLMNTPAPSHMYAKLCKSIGMIDWNIAKMGIFTRACLDLREELILLDEEYRKRCFPLLLVSLLAQPMPRIGRMARGLYAHMEQHDYPLSVKSMCHILRLSKYTRQDDLSFAKILARVVEQGHRPEPNLAIQVLQNMFPYTKLDETILALKTIIHLQSSWEPGAPHPTYKVDVGLLEHIMAAAARKGAFELNILVWDLVDLLGYEPTEFMYENTIQGFAMGAQQDHNVFGVLSEMEERGFSPSRALIRSISRSIRFSYGRVENAHYLLETLSEEQDGAQVTLSSLNAVLSAAAEKPDVNRAFNVFEDFDLYGIEPNYDSYSYLLESLSKNLIPSREGYKERMVHAPERLDAAAAILSLMEERNIPRCQHCVEQYTQLLFNVGRLDAATEFLLDSLERGDPVNNRIIINMSKNNALAGNIEVARLMATKTSEPFEHLIQRIDDIEKRLLHQQKSSSNDTEKSKYSDEIILEE